MDPSSAATPRSPNRLIQGLGVLLMLCLGVWLWMTSEEIVSTGCHQQGYSVYLTKDGLDFVTTDLADRVCQAADPGRQLLNVEVLSSAAAAAVVRARAKARDQHADDSPTVVALDELHPDRIQLEWRPASFDAEVVLTGSTSFQTGRPETKLPPLERGKLFFGRVEIQVVPWPRKPKYTRHPEILLAQSSVSWHSPVSGSGILAEELAAVLAEHAAERVQQAAAAQGLEASRTLPGRRTR